MNLTSDPWIPIVWQDGSPGTVSLVDAFARGSEIRDLSVWPHERIALMRLLICIAQAALDGPEDHTGWQACRSKIAESALSYLRRWRHAFELLGDGQRFLQMKGDGQAGTMALDKLDFVDAEMTTLFDHDVAPGRQRSLEWTALHLVTYQSFAAGGTVGGSIEVAGKQEPQKGKNGPCRDRSAFHSFVKRENLIDTVHSNMVPKDSLNRTNLDWGAPVWEIGATRIFDLRPSVNLTRSYLGRLAPLSRAVWLNEDRSTALNANGLAYGNYEEEGMREPTASVRVLRDRQGQQRRVLLSAVDGDSIKKPWRELHALAVKRISDEGVGGPLALVNLNDDEPLDLWVGALVTRQAKIDDTVESSYPVPARMLHAGTQRTYEIGVRHAEAGERRLRQAIETYRLAMETNETRERLQTRLRGMRLLERRRLSNISGKACSSYWTLIEYRLELLIRFALGPVPLRDGVIEYHETDWGSHVRRAVATSYERACPHETPRQIRAYSLGLEKLNPSRVDRETIESEEQEEESA